MRKASADYNAIEAALLPHQLRTLSDLARVRGARGWQEEPTCCGIAVALAVENRSSTLMAEGLSERQAHARTAAELDLDVETLRRQRRAARRRSRDRTG